MKVEREAVNHRSVLFCFFVFFSEKKKEKEREELWKKLEDLELKRGLRSDAIIPT